MLMLDEGKSQSKGKGRSKDSMHSLAIASRRLRRGMATARWRG